MNSAYAWNGPWTTHAHDAARSPHRFYAEGEPSHGRGRRGRKHGRHQGFGPPGQVPWGGMPMPPMAPGPPMPPFPPGPGGPFGHRLRKARRGDVRAAILSLLSQDGPLNGYQVMQTIAERSQGGWRPSPGAVYPALQQLTDEGLIEPTGEGRRTMFELTEAGRSYVEQNREEVDAPWEAMTPQFDDDVIELMNLAQQSGTALMQVIQSAGPTGRAKARKVLEDGRRQLYQILADGEDDAEEPDDGE